MLVPLITYDQFNHIIKDFILDNADELTRQYAALPSHLNNYEMQCSEASGQLAEDWNQICRKSCAGRHVVKFIGKYGGTAKNARESILRIVKVYFTEQSQNQLVSSPNIPISNSAITDNKGDNHIMTNKELYDNAVSDGLEFRYFHGEEENPYDNKYSSGPQSSYWEAEQDLCCSDDTDEIIEDFEKIPTSELPEFITSATASVASKATAWAAHKCFIESIPAPINCKNYKMGPFGDYFE